MKALIFSTLGFLLFAFTLPQGKQVKETPLQQSVARGKEVYRSDCQHCHGENGEGIEGVFPPLAKADYLKDPRKSIQSIVKGLKGPLTVNGKAYDSEMEPLSQLNDQQIADVMNFIYNNWGNKGRFVQPEEVKGLRK